MAIATEFIRALELHRSRRLAEADGPPPLDPAVLAAWIHHDNMLEGVLYRPEEIAAAVSGRDGEHDAYLVPLLTSIRRYRDAVRFVWTQAAEGREAVSLANLKAIHKLLTNDPKDRGGQYRRTSPVHRDYYQRICPAEKVPYNLRKLFENIESACDDACDPVLFAADVHRQLMEIYPFRRNPGTTGRLFTNLLLMSRGYPPVILQSGRRREYYDALCKADAVALGALFREGVANYLDGALALGSPGEVVPVPSLS